MRQQRLAASLVIGSFALLSASGLCAQGSGPAHAHAPEDTTQATPQARLASGTAWQPDGTPMHGLARGVGAWRLMAHGSASAAYMWAQTRKGGTRTGITNWAMARASRPLAGGALSITAMGSLETLTVGDCGFPGLLASTSTCPSNAFRDFQHPHPPLMELSLRHEQPLRGPLRFELYGGVVGEPALGPPGYQHRVSAAADPAAPISGHETNAAHASSGVLSLGIGTGVWKVEGSVFDGAPAEVDRILPRAGPLEAVAGRISVNPSPRWSLQASMGRIPAEAGHHQGAAGAIRVLTASAMHQRALRESGHWASTLILARMEDGTLPRNSLLLESSLSLRDRHTWFGRLELADRLDGQVTIIEHPDGSHDHLVDYRRLQVAQVAAGYLLSRQLRGAHVGIGARASLSLLPAELQPVYQRQWPASVSLYLSVQPGSPQHHH